MKKTIATCITVLLFCLVLPGNIYAASQKALFLKADKEYRTLLATPSIRKYRSNWIKCINRFKAIYDKDPGGSVAPAALYMTGVLHDDLSKFSYRESDRQTAIKHLTHLVRKYPSSLYRKKAEIRLSLIYSKNPEDRPKPVITKERTVKRAGKSSSKKLKKAVVIKRFNAKRKPPVARKKTVVKKTAPKTVVTKNLKTGGKVTGIRFWSNPDYTRVVLDAKGDFNYKDTLLKKDPDLKKPQRLFIDLKGAALDNGLSKVTPINDNLLKDIRAGQYTSDTVRVVLDIKSFKDYKIFSLKNPFRIVIDVWGSKGAGNGVARSGKSGKTKTSRVKSPQPKDIKVNGSALARQLALGVRRIIIDPGHGGRDGGAPGYYKGVNEKAVTLAIARRLSEKIKKELGCEVLLTRNSDKYITLEERTAFANTRNADLFISIHTNAAKNKKAYGIETYFLNLATDESAISVAARENATSEKNISDLQSILNDLMQNAKINESSRLAYHVQSSMNKGLRRKFSKIKNKGVKQAPFYVLLGAHMPAILIETSFISNPRECKRLTSRKFQDELCDSIIAGVKRYIHETSPL